MIADGGFGRPEDKDIEKQFMKKIRGDKLQAINAECELEICLAFKEDSHQKQTKKNARSKKSTSPKGEQNLIQEQQVLTIGINGLNLDRRQQLFNKFKELKDQWQFEEIEEGQPLPQYFFDDGCDLSYILHGIKEQEKTQGMFNAGELIFLELLCLWGRKLLNKSVLQEYSNHEIMTFMLELMETGLEKIQNKLKDGHREEKGSGNQREEMQEENQMANMQNNESEVEASSQKKGKKKGPPKTKKITKNASKAKKSKKKQQSEEQDDEQDSNKETIPKQKQLAVKTVNYICWAYWYIIKKND